MMRAAHPPTLVRVRLYEIVREDEFGVAVAEAVEFENGSVAVGPYMLSDPPNVSVFASLDDMLLVHERRGERRVVGRETPDDFLGGDDLTPAA